MKVIATGTPQKLFVMTDIIKQANKNIISGANVYVPGSCLNLFTPPLSSYPIANR